MRGGITNNFGITTAFVGVFVFVIAALLAKDERGVYFHSDYIPGYASGVGLIVFGVLIRPLGVLLFWCGLLIIFATILHAIVYHVLELDFLNFGYYHDQLIQFEVFGLVAGIGICIASAYLARTKDQEAHAAAVSTQRRSEQQATQQAMEQERRANTPTCPNCGSEAPGGMFATRMYTCNACGGQACQNCSGGFMNMGQSCPHCGNTENDRVTFHDTGASY